MRLADELGIGIIWDEATRGSAAFYQKVLDLPQVNDHFPCRFQPPSCLLPSRDNHRQLSALG